MSEMGLAIQDLVIRSASAAVLDGFCLEVPPGERLGLVGPSGAGKSTLSLAMLGYIAPGLHLAGGDLRVGTEPIITSGRLNSPANIRKIRRRIGRLDQDPAASLTPTHRIGRLMAELSAAPSRLAAAERDGALRVFGLPTTKNFLARFPAELSGGQRRRVALARTLLRRPGLLILDEPTAGLDPQAVDAVLGLVEALVDELAATLIVITHDPAVAERLADRVIAIPACGKAGGIGPAGTASLGYCALKDAGESSGERLGGQANGVVGKTGGVLLSVQDLVAGAPGLAIAPVQGLSFDLHSGEALALTGASGSGKTTVVRSLLGLWPRTGGEVLLGQDRLPARLDDWPVQLAGALGWVPQDPATSVNPAVRLGVALRRAARRAKGQGGGMHVDQAAAVVGLPAGWQDRFPRQLSGGQVQRFAIARALVGGARVLLLDEVTSNLDPVTRDEICALLNTLKKQVPLLIITHDPQLVAACCDREISLTS